LAASVSTEIIIYKKAHGGLDWISATTFGDWLVMPVVEILPPHKFSGDGNRKRLVATGIFLPAYRSRAAVRVGHTAFSSYRGQGLYVRLP
jgi:hypothetical protein